MKFSLVLFLFITHQSTENLDIPVGLIVGGERCRVNEIPFIVLRMSFQEKSIHCNNIYLLV